MTSPHVKLRVEPSKRSVWEAAADASNLTLSGFIKKACDTAATGAPYLTPAEIDAFHQVAEQLRRAGINLNVLVRDLQALQLGRHKMPPDDEQFAELHTELKEALSMVRALLQTKL